MTSLGTGTDLEESARERRLEPDTVAAHLAARRSQARLLRAVAVLAVMLTGSLVLLVTRPSPMPAEWTAFAFRV